MSDNHTNGVLRVDLILNRWGYPADSSGRDSSLSQIESAIAKATGCA